jgi:allophanate hydrolase subunit 1
MYEVCKYIPSGDSSIIIEIGNEISDEINKKIRGLEYCIENNHFEEINEIIPTYKSISLIYNPLKTSYYELVKS